MGKIRKVESAKEKNARLKHEKELREYRAMIHEDPRKLKNVWTSIVAFDKDAKESTLLGFIDSYMAMIETLHSTDQNIETIEAEMKRLGMKDRSMLKRIKSMRKSNMKTPDAAKTMTDIFKLTEDFNRTIMKEAKKRNINMNEVGVGRANDLLHEVYSDYREEVEQLEMKMVMLESQVHKQYAECEQLFAVITYNFYNTETLNNMLIAALEGKLITEQEFYLFKAFNTFRNFITHNLSTSAVIELGRNNMITMFKAILLESKKILLDLATKHHLRLILAYNVVANPHVPGDHDSTKYLQEDMEAYETKLGLPVTNVIEVIKKHGKLKEGE